MKIIISPAKQMRIDSDTLAPGGMPVFLKKAEQIKAWMQSQSPSALKKLWGCNDKIAAQNLERLQDMDLSKNLTPAILAYDGIAYKYMAPIVFEDAHFSYVQENLRILSGFYGVLKPLDGIIPYRLEMMAKAKIDGHKSLYDFWSDDLYRETRDETGLFVNLASKEYSKCIEKYMTDDDFMVSHYFGELSGDKLIQKTVHVKMARGEMVRFMAENKIKTPEGMKEFNRLGFSFDESRSTETQYVFLK